MPLSVGPVRRIALAAIAAAMSCAHSHAQNINHELPEVFKGVDLVSHLGETIPLDLQFTGPDGKRVPLSKYFNKGKPVVIALVYFRCPMTCPLVLDRLQFGLNGLSYIAGADFNTLVISFDPTETAAAAAEQKMLYLGGYTKPVTQVVKDGWEFLVSPDSSASMLARSVGFQYKFIPDTSQYSHPTALVVLTPEGKVARYISGLDYTSQDLRLALLEASEGKIAKTMGDFFLHFCYRYDATTGRYTVHAWTIMRVGAILTALSLGTLITGLRASERLKRHRRAAALRSTALPNPSLIGHAR